MRLDLNIRKYNESFVLVHLLCIFYITPDVLFDVTTVQVGIYLYF